MPRAAATRIDLTADATTLGRPLAPTRRRSRTPRVQPSVPLGSLTQPGARGSARCAECGSDCVTNLQMTLTDGTPVSFTSCHRCESRTWNELDGNALPVDKVLKKARKPR